MITVGVARRREGVAQLPDGAVLVRRGASNVLHLANLVPSGVDGLADGLVQVRFQFASEAPAGRSSAIVDPDQHDASVRVRERNDGLLKPLGREPLLELDVLGLLGI